LRFSRIERLPRLSARNSADFAESSAVSADGRFIAYTSLGAGIWCLILTYIGYLLGQHEETLRNEDVQRYVGHVLVYLLPALALLAVLYVVWNRRRRAKPPQST